MLDPIDRHALLTRIYEYPPERDGMSTPEWYRKCIYEAPSLPTFRSEVRRGRWITQEDADGDISFVCSECSRRLQWDEDFCPSCGSDMRTVNTKD